MKFKPDIHHRRSIRLRHYDYSRAGLYFITICTQNHLYLFGEIENGKILLNDMGIMIKTIWDEIPVYYPDFNIHEFVVMPNHIHGIIEINPKSVGTRPVVAPTKANIGESHDDVTAMSLSDIMHRFKTLTTKRYTDGVKHNSWARFNKRLWQRNY